LVEFGGWNALFTGDLGKEAQEALLSRHQLSDVSVIKVSHHGSADQSPRFYEVVNADVAVFSTGKENNYGHPRQETIDLVEKFGAVSARTDIQGMIVISGGKNSLELWSEH
jgi:competence protein ComEC